MAINTNSCAAAPDQIFQLLTMMHENLSMEESNRANARLIFILANHIGDLNVIADATRIARESTVSS